MGSSQALKVKPLDGCGLHTEEGVGVGPTQDKGQLDPIQFSEGFSQGGPAVRVKGNERDGLARWAYRCLHAQVTPVLQPRELVVGEGQGVQWESVKA